MQLARLASQIEPELAGIVETWENLTVPARKITTIESICVEKNVDPGHFCGVVVEAAIKFRDNATYLIAALNMPEIIQQSVKFAKRPEGIRDREAFMKHSGFLPTPQGSRVNILNQATANAAAQVEANVERGLPSFERSMSDLEEE